MIGATGGAGDITRGEVAWNIAIACLLIVVGVGLCLDGRWAWPLALLVSGFAIGLGLYLMMQPGDITNPGAPIVSLVAFVIPGALLVATLATPRSVRWFRGRP